MQRIAQECARKVGADGAIEIDAGDHLRLGAGLGAAGLASGFAASHFEGGWWISVFWVVGMGERNGVALVECVESVETMDCLLLLGGGAVL